MTLRIASTLTLIAALAGPAYSEPLDFDGLAACSIIYQRIGDLYSGKGETDQADSFASTAQAYSFVSWQVLGREDDQGWDYANSRMMEVAQSLNESITSEEKGELGVIEQWLPYCDMLGPQVDAILTQMDAN